MTCLVQDNRRPSTDLEKEGVDCTGEGLVGRYTTFAVTAADADSHSSGGGTTSNKKMVKYNGLKAVSLHMGQGRFFDLKELDGKKFSFTHIIIYPTVMPESCKGAMFIAVRVKEDRPYAKRAQFVADRYVEFVTSFQTIIYLCFLREGHQPANMDCFSQGVQNVWGYNARNKGIS